MSFSDDVKISLQDLGAALKEKRAENFPSMTRSEFAEEKAKIDIEAAKNIEYGRGDVTLSDFITYAHAIGINNLAL